MRRAPTPLLLFALVLGVLNASLGVAVEAGRPLFSVDISRMDACDRMGFGSEWATAFGLALKMTKGQFAPRDGKRRGIPGRANDEGRSARVAEAHREPQRFPGCLP